MIVNLDNATTRWTLAVAVASLFPLSDPVFRVLTALDELAALPAPADEAIAAAYLSGAGLHAAWAADGDSGAVLLALREEKLDALADAERAYERPQPGVWVARPWSQDDPLRTWSRVRHSLLREPEAWPQDAIDLGGGARAFLLVREPGPRVLVLGVSRTISELGELLETRTLVKELDGHVDLASFAGIPATYRLYRRAAVEPREHGVTPDKWLLERLGEPAALALAISDHCGDEPVRPALGLGESTLRRLRAMRHLHSDLNDLVDQLTGELYPTGEEINGQ